MLHHGDTEAQNLQERAPCPPIRSLQAPQVALLPKPVLLGVFPGSVIDAAQELVRFGISDRDSLFAIPPDAAAELQGKHRAQAHTGRVVPRCDVIHRAPARPNGVEKVGPELADILQVTWMQLGSSWMVLISPLGSACNFVY